MFGEPLAAKISSNRINITDLKSYWNHTCQNLVNFYGTNDQSWRASFFVWFQISLRLVFLADFLKSNPNVAFFGSIRVSYSSRRLVSVFFSRLMWLSEILLSSFFLTGYGLFSDSFVFHYFNRLLVGWTENRILVRNILFFFIRWFSDSNYSYLIQREIRIIC